MAAEVNYMGIAAVIVASTGALTVVGTFVMQVLGYIRAGKILKLGEDTHNLVDGGFKRLNEAEKDVARLEGEKVGAATEQARGALT